MTNKTVTLTCVFAVVASAAIYVAAVFVTEARHSKRISELVPRGDTDRKVYLRECLRSVHYDDLNHRALTICSLDYQAFRANAAYEDALNRCAAAYAPEHSYSTLMVTRLKCAAGTQHDAQ